MKKNIITTFVLALLILGPSTSIYAKPVKLIEVPEYIGNYKTIDILEYFMNTKQKIEVKETDKNAETKKVEEKTKINKSNIVNSNAHM